MRQKTIRISPEYSDIDEIIKQYHFSEDDKGKIKSLYQKHFSMPKVQITYEVLLNQHKNQFINIDLINYSVAVLTLGEAIDDIIEGYLESEQILEAYILDAIALRIMSRAYESLIKDLTSDTGMAVTALEFLGDKYPVELTKEIINKLRPEGITLGESYMLHPLKSVCLIMPLSEDKLEIPVENLCNTCTNCGNINCVLRKFDK